MSIERSYRHCEREAQRYRDRVSSGLCTRCGKLPSEPNRKSCKACLVSLNTKAKLYNKKVNIGLCREIVLDHYGRECACCGEANTKFLTIDHMNSDGAEHRKTVRSSQLTTWLIKSFFPEGFQVLCWNCNCGRQMNGGVCPHKETI